MSGRRRLIVTGFMGSCPIAGVVWQHLHYIVGLQRLGHEVYYIEDSARLPYNPVTFEVGEDFSHAASTLERLSKIYGFEERWAFRARYLAEESGAGLSRDKVNELFKHADAILNVCGSQELHEEIIGGAPLLYIESDPGLEQIRMDQGAAGVKEYLGAHHALFTFGELVGHPNFPVPLHGLKWLPTRQPVVVDFWKGVSAPADAVFTTVANWSTEGKKDIEWRGKKYLWSKSPEFLRFSGVPQASGEVFEMATDIKDADTKKRFESQNWRLVLPHDLSADEDLYRKYVQSSRGEFTVAKDQYVRLHTGWFSDRTACYLACGRPALTQETGFSEVYGDFGGGLFGFRDPEDVPAMVAEIRADYGKHCRAASQIAEEIFSAERVLAKLLNDARI